MINSAHVIGREVCKNSEFIVSEVAVGSGGHKGEVISEGIFTLVLKKRTKCNNIPQLFTLKKFRDSSFF